MTSLAGFGISQYRSFRAMQYFAPLGKVTLLAGQNNAGKSNVLRFVHDNLTATPVAPEAIDRPLNSSDGPGVRLALGVDSEEMLHDVPGEPHNERTPRGTLERVFAGDAIRGPNDLIWFQLIQTRTRNAASNSPMRWVIDDQQARDLTNGLKSWPRVAAYVRNARNVVESQQWQGGNLEHDIRALLAHYLPDLRELPEVRRVEAFREIRPSRGEADGLGLFNGYGLIERLEQLERPSLANQADTEKFERINRFLQHIIEDEGANLRIPHDAETVLVERSGGVLPLASLGTGVHQLILLAAAATLLSGNLLCIEEPEVHLHPLFQRRLVRYLANQTENRYMIATHSAHLLDYEAGQVFHLRHTVEGGTLVDFAGTPSQQAAICADLGYRPSDLLQTNAVIWVEGPSDRIYVRHWIELLAPDLIEGVDYSIMFYGGRLLSHLTPNDPLAGGLAEKEHDREVEDFISLRRLNRYLVVIIDSDRTSPRKRLNQTKTRVRRAFDASDGPGFVWITRCYTVENYVPPMLLKRAVDTVHPRVRLQIDGGQWSPPLPTDKAAALSKVAIARQVCMNWSKEELDVLDLQDRIRDLVDLIDLASGRTARRDWRS